MYWCPLYISETESTVRVQQRKPTQTNNIYNACSSTWFPQNLIINYNPGISGTEIIIILTH